MQRQELNECCQQAVMRMAQMLPSAVVDVDGDVVTFNRRVDLVQAAVDNAKLVKKLEDAIIALQNELKKEEPEKVEPEEVQEEE